MILVIDNYDSFTYNLVQALEAAEASVRVVRNDEITAADLGTMADDANDPLGGILISPGPGGPEDSGISIAAIELARERGLPMLGVCLGMQAIAASFGASVVRAPTLVHGEASTVRHDAKGYLASMPLPFPAARYHSLCVDAGTLPAETGGQRARRRRRSDGHPPHDAAHRGRPVPSRIGADAGWSAHPRPLPASVRRRRAGDPRVATGLLLQGNRGMSDAVKAAIAEVMRGGSLGVDEAHAAMASVMEGEATPAQLGGLLLALRMRGEKADELTGFAMAMRERVLAVSAPEGAIDTCGTGGDGSQTFNISTASALVVAAAGVPVAKHGNRAMSSATGSADVLEALGIPIDLSPDQAAEALATDGFAFLFAPSYHPAMRHAGPVRRELGVPTAFNLLGPMTNPAGVRRQVIGVADPTTAAKVAHVLYHLGTQRAFVVHGAGVDELPLDGTGVAYDVTTGGVRKRRIDSSALGLDVCSEH